MKISKRKSLCFKDVNLLSILPSKVKSRDSINFNNNRIIAAPMSAFMGETFIKCAIQLGISLPIHRFNNPEEQANLLNIAIEQKNMFNSSSILWLAVGLHDYKERIEKNLDKMQLNNIGILLDIANGYHLEVENFVENIKKYQLPNLFTGNIHTLSGWKFLESLNSKFIRVGIGNGAVCLTTKQTGIGRGQLTIIDEIYSDFLFSNNAAIVSDGGIKEAGDAAKAFACGAEYVMIGSLFSKAREAECNLNGNGIFYGGASTYAKELLGLNKNHIEGSGELVEKSSIAPLESIVKKITDGIKSSISYSGYESLEEYIGNGFFEMKNF